MLDHSEAEPRPKTSSPVTDAVLLRIAAYLILEPVASALAVGMLFGGIGENVASFAFGTLIGGLAAAIVRQKYRDGRL